MYVAGVIKVTSYAAQIHSEAVALEVTCWMNRETKRAEWVNFVSAFLQQHNFADNNIVMRVHF